MSTGKRFAALLLLSTSLAAPHGAFAQGTAGAADPGTSTLPDDSPATDAQAAADTDPAATAPPAAGEEPVEPQPDISAPGGEIVVTARRRTDITRSSTQVVSVLSSEQIARTGEGNIAGALGRVTGLSVQGQGLVYVRGLGDRYSLAMLNGLPLPSPQPLSRVVPLDIFPTNIVASSLVQKTYSANYPGEFGGGVINLTTRAVPDEPFLKLSAGISGDEQTLGHDGFDYYGSSLDWTGFDDGARDLPPALAAFLGSGARLSDVGVDQQAIVRDLGDPNKILLQRVGNLPVNWSFGLTGGTAIDLGDANTLGMIATASISNRWRNRSIVKQTAVGSNLDLNSDFRDFTTDNRVLVNALLGFGLELGDQKIRWTNLFIRDTLKQSSLALGEDFSSGFSEATQQTGWFERQLLDSQVVAELKFGDLSLDLRGGWAQTQREAPHEYEFTYVRTNNPNDPLGSTYINILDRQRGSGKVSFSDLTEELWFGGVDLSYPVLDWATATIGYAYSDTTRQSTRREFLFNAGGNFVPGVGALRPDYLLGDGVVDFYKIGLIESTQADPAFSAGLEIHGAYGQLRLSPVDPISLDIGVRYETATQRVDPVEVFATPTNSASTTLLENEYWLPAATLTWEATDRLQLRLHGSKTIARPQFRELIFQTYYDPESNRQYNGNPLLVDSTLINAEARAEYYFDRSNRVTLAGFYKDISNPIEAYSSFSDNNQLTSFANAPGAILYGAEFDVNYGIGLADWGTGEWLASKRLVLGANYTYTKSEIQVAAADTTQIFPGGTRPASDYFVDGAPLTGQSDHMANFQLSLEDTDRVQQFTVMVSYASERVTSRGTSGLPDILENPGVRLDFVAREEVEFYGRPVELKLEARNILGRDYEEYQQAGDRRIEVNSYEVGPSVALSMGIEF
ncbi:MAG: TonB-dependent receptor [Citromicrobium sp.]|nr:MAG: TonB-dependent receptor [Citromicrobium sp.]